MRNQEFESWLAQLAGDFIAALTSTEMSIKEGIVMTTGPAPYRRLDCDGRALAYIRTRPKKRAVRIDVTGLWRTPRGGSRLRIPNAGGATTLLLRSEADREDAVRFLQKTVAKTRAAAEKQRKAS